MRDDTGKVYDIVAGTFFVCGVNEDNFVSLSPEQMEKLKSEFRTPEAFSRIGGKTFIAKVEESRIHTTPPTHGNRGDR